MSFCEPRFVPGRELSRAFFEQVVSPLVDAAFPRLSYAAGILGPGSDVLGYDTARSMDHDWGPRCTLVLTARDSQAIGPRLRDVLTNNLPRHFQGHSIMFQSVPDDPGVAVPATAGCDASVFHRVEILSLPSFFARLDYEPGDEKDAAFWLTVTEQQLLECTSGVVFRDDLGDLSRIRDALSRYPDDVWHYRMAAMWKRIAQIEPFVGRTREAGDAIGSFVIGARLVEDIMRLALLQVQRYAPYSKWLGTAFARMEGSRELGLHLDTVRTAPTWKAREAAIVSATSALVAAHNMLEITPYVDPSPRPFYSRPFTVIDAERVCDALSATLGDSAISRLPVGLGGIDQFIDSTDALISPWLRRSIRTAMRQTMSPDT